MEENTLFKFLVGIVCVKVQHRHPQDLNLMQSWLVYKQTLCLNHSLRRQNQYQGNL